MHLIAAFGRALLYVVAGAVAVLVLLLVFHNRIINNVYKNVADLNDGEMPSTITSYPSGPEVVAIIGGSGQGLNCSLPPYVDALFDQSADANGNRHLVRQRFRQACVFHDLCYRHGLATYGYTQNDCDRILQNQAHRLCLYLPNQDKTGERCQRDAKKVLAGVNLWGFGSYRGWDRSTYFEFDSTPIRSLEFEFSRVVAHPLKSLNPAKYGDEPNEVILRFVNQRSHVTVRCISCGDKSVLEPSKDPQNVSDEFRAVGLQARPEALLGRGLSLNGSRSVWLPRGPYHGAPHFVADPSGQHHLVWMSRADLENTGSCFVVADARRMLTYTLAQTNACDPSAKSPLTLANVEMYSSSPQPMIIPAGPDGPGGLFATSLTVQRDAQLNLYFCGWSERMRKSGSNRASCTLLKEDVAVVGKEIGAFQNFAIVRPGQQIFFAREIATKPSRNMVGDFIERTRGNPYSSKGRLLVVNIAQNAAGGLGAVTLEDSVPFEIDDTFDPMVPLSSAKDDLRFLSITSSDTDAGLYLTDFRGDDPKPREIHTKIGTANLALHPSWMLRPVLVVETRNGGSPKTQLVFSRARLAAADPANTTDIAQFETLVFDRDRGASIETPFTLSRAASCQVTYRWDRAENGELVPPVCRRSFDITRPMRPSPAAMTQAAQMVAGRFTKSGRLSLGVIDGCFHRNPIVLEPADAAQQQIGGFTTGAPAVAGHLRRQVDCESMDSVAGRRGVTPGQWIERELPGVGATSTGRSLSSY